MEENEMRLPLQMTFRHIDASPSIEDRLDITVPGREIVVGLDSKPGRSHDNIAVAIHDAFAAARRQIEDHARIHRGEVKLHSLPDYGRIIRLFPKEEYGFIETADNG